MEEEILLKVKPKFSFIYELFMPSGRKIRNSLIETLFFGIIYLIFNYFIKENNLENAKNILNIFLMALTFICAIKFIINLVLQCIQYSKISYNFYKDKVIYEDTFLNQHKKEVMYLDIKEVELRRKIWDRINNKGVIMIYSNAEKKFNNGIIMISIKDANNVYNKVRSVIYNK